MELQQIAWVLRRARPVVQLAGSVSLSTMPTEVYELVRVDYSRPVAGTLRDAARLQIMVSGSLEVLVTADEHYYAGDSIYKQESSSQDKLSGPHTSFLGASSRLSVKDASTHSYSPGKASRTSHLPRVPFQFHCYSKRCIRQVHLAQRFRDLHSLRNIRYRSR